MMPIAAKNRIFSGVKLYRAKTYLLNKLIGAHYYLFIACWACLIIASGRADDAYADVRTCTPATVGQPCDLQQFAPLGYSLNNGNAGKCTSYPHIWPGACCDYPPYTDKYGKESGGSQCGAYLPQPANPQSNPSAVPDPCKQPYQSGCDGSNAGAACSLPPGTAYPYVSAGTCGPNKDASAYLSDPPGDSTECCGYAWANLGSGIDAVNGGCNDKGCALPSITYVCAATKKPTDCPVSVPESEPSTPEMSDYLAIAFVLGASAMVYAARKRRA